MSGNPERPSDVTHSMSVLPPDPAETLQPDALEQQLRELARPEPEWSVAKAAAQDIAWARLLAPPLPATSLARDVARQIAQDAQPTRAAEAVAVAPRGLRPAAGWRGGYAAFVGALALMLLPTMLPGAGTLAGEAWAALGMGSPLGWSGAVWLGLGLAASVALVLSIQGARWQPSAPRWSGGALLALCLLPLLLTERPTLPAAAQMQGLLSSEQTGAAAPLPWPVLLGVVALLMLVRWPNAARPVRFTPAVARGVLGLGLGLVGTLALLRLNLKGLGLGGLLLTALSLLVGLSVALKALVHQLVSRLRLPASGALEAVFGLGGLALLTLEPRVAAPAALLGGVWGLGQLLSPAEAARPVAA